MRNASDTGMAPSTRLSLRRFRLSRWVQNNVVGPPGEPPCDGVGELWFDSDEAMTKALNSPEMGAAVEDAKNFLDMSRTGLIIVEEKSVV